MDRGGTLVIWWMMIFTTAGSACRGNDKNEMNHRDKLQPFKTAKPV
jgi:hypothetical protein